MAVLSSPFTYLMALASLLALPAVFAQAPTLGTEPKQFTSPPAEHALRDDLTCALDDIAPRPTHPDAFRPWTHEPYCIHPADKPLLGFCTFTNADFMGGRGLSVVTLPELAAAITNRTKQAMSAAEAAAENPYVFDQLFPRVKYEERMTEDRGRGLFATESLRVGETIFVDYPTMLIVRDSVEVFLPEERIRMNWMGLLQLSDVGRAETRDMASNGRYKDELDNLITMNSLGVQYGAFRHMGIFPEAANHIYER
ncbi:hypothetical protein jhhlp_006776 [Lomentospora prolificans]|uniref:SET domain-containing protein n=1 Tax=Lomentospora prolificans TaxID=41688 RepID=A0A2N3N2R0_9PEZI|nr:hypothetical protein jhhlp_006776 [Lomentospora prolificans]